MLMYRNQVIYCIVDPHGQAIDYRKNERAAQKLCDELNEENTETEKFVVVKKEM